MAESTLAEAKRFRALKASLGGAPGASRPPGQIVLPATRAQLKVLGCSARFIAVTASRRFGKTTLGVLKILELAKVSNPLGLIWWVAPTYRQGQRPFRQLLSIAARAGLLQSVNRAAKSLKLVTGWTVEFRSAELYDNLRGEGVDFLVIDEYRQIADEAWYEALRPTLADTGGRALVIGTPGGRRGWGYALHLRGRDDAQPNYASFEFSVADAAFIPPEEVEEARRTLPQRAFEQEFLAKFLDSAGAVFEDVRRRPRLLPKYNEAVAVGVDWAKKRDWTWFVAVGAQSGAVLDCARIQRIGYVTQVKLLQDFLARFSRAPGLQVCHDRTGVGEALDDLLLAAGIEAEGLVFSEATKRQLVEEGVVDFEAGRLGFIPEAESRSDYDALIREHEDFALDVGKTGKIFYGAPEGLHDDAVFATLLANRARRELWRDEIGEGAPALDWIGGEAARWRLVGAARARPQPWEEPRRYAAG